MASEEQSNLAKMIILLVVLVVLMYWGSTFLLDSTLEHDNTCQKSISTYTKLLDSFPKISSADAQRIAEEGIDCPANRIELKDDDEKIKKVIADDLVQCWKNYGEGDLQLFKGEGTFCSVCSFYSFKDDGGELSGMPLFLKETVIPREEFTYAEYLAGVANDPDSEISDRVSDQDFEQGGMDRSKQYASILYYAKGNTGWEKVKGLFTSTNGVFVAAGAVGATSSIVALIVTAPVSVPVVLAIGTAGLLSVAVADVSLDLYNPRLDYAAFVSLEEFSAENINNRCDIIAVKVIEE